MLRKFIFYCAPIVVLAMFGAPAFAGVAATYSPIQHSWPDIPGTRLVIPLYPDPNVPEGPAGSDNQKVPEGIGYLNRAVMQTFWVPADSNGFTLTDLVVTGFGPGTDTNPYCTLHLFDINQEPPNPIPHEESYIPAYDGVPPSYDWFSTACRFIYERDTNDPSPDKFVMFSFSDYDKVELVPNHLYALEIWPTRDIDASWAWIRGATGTVANPYPDGRAFWVADDVGKFEDLTVFRYGIGGSPRDMVLGVYGVPHDGNAYHPTPRNYEPLGPVSNVLLTWKPGADVNDPCEGDNLGHQVWFSSRYDYVNSRSGPPATLKKARVTDPCWMVTDVTGPLAFDTTYYWRVDEYNDSYPSLPPAGYWGGPVWRFTTVGPKARNPIPASGTPNIEFLLSDLNLRWTAGSSVNDVCGHHVYFGTSYADVNAESPAAPIDRGYVSSPIYSLLNLAPDYKLTSGVTYYWRVDEVNEGTAGSPWRGDVWSFKLPDPAYLIVELFSYGNQEQLDEVWKTGYKSPLTPPGGDYNTVSGTVAPADARLQFTYNNDAPEKTPWSEAKLDYNNVASDWLANGVFDACMIGINYDGALTNSLAPDPSYDKMYMAVEDGDGNFGLVSHPDPYAPRRLLDDIARRQWKVYLSDLAGDVNLADVNAFYLGFGLRDSWAGRTYGEPREGTVTFDNLRLYAQHCVPEMVALEGDFAGPRLSSDNRFTPRDCQVNIHDAFYFASDWLFTEPDINYVGSIVDPAIAGGLRVWYMFDEGSGTTVSDSSGNYYDGSIGNLSPLAWGNPGHDGDGNCLNFEWGCRTWVEVPEAAYDETADAVTLAVWTNYDVSHQVIMWASVVLLFSDTAQLIETQIPTPFPPDFGWGPSGRFTDMRTGGVSLWWNPQRFSTFGGKMDDGNDRWNHWAFVYDGAADAMRIYHNGRRVADANNTLPLWTGVSLVRLCTVDRVSSPSWGGFWAGMLDDFRMYNRALSDNEIQWLATDGAGFRSMQNIEPTDMVHDNRIDFRDFADFADAWLEE